MTQDQTKDLMHYLASKAGKIMKDHFRKDWNTVTIKADGTPASLVDTMTNDLVISTIREAYPGHDIIGEEMSYRTESDYTWVCDPLDGTKPYLLGIPVSVFMLAKRHMGETVAAIIHSPWEGGLTCYAEKGIGTTLNGEKTTVNSHDSLEGAVVGYSFWKKAPEYRKHLHADLVEAGCNVVQAGSIGYTGMLVATGSFSAVLYGGDCIHDIAALQLIIPEAGGKVSDFYGNPAGMRGLLGSNGLIHKAIQDDMIR